tara:strand:- start:19585 stop:20154 length:570 start_codon:yes stop_codon:yes gene_type:complete
MAGSSIIQNPEIQKAVVPMSVDFYHASGELGWVDENVELLHGIPVEKMSKSPEHEYFVYVLLRLLEEILPDTHFVAKERPLTTADSEPEPDLMVVKGEERSFRTSHPSTAALVVEVSVSTIERDRLKAAIYASAGVQEYWIVDPSRAAVTVFRCPEKDNYANQQEWVGTGLVSSNAIPGFQLDLATFFS